MNTAVAISARDLSDIASDIRAHWQATEDDRFAIGRCLMEAREQFPSDPEFGQWMAAENFPFTSQWALMLRRAAENEVEVRAALESQLSRGKRPNIEKAVREVTQPTPVAPIAILEPVADIKSEVSAVMDALTQLANLEATIERIRVNWTPEQQNRLVKAAKRAAKVIDHLQVEQL